METMKRATGSRRVTRVCRLATASLLLATIAAGQGAGQAAAPQPTTIPGAASHIYKSINGVDLRLHVFTPPGQRPGDRRPAIVLFFGGGWNQGSIMQFVPQATHFASRGMVAIVADYRVRFRHDSTPYQSIADAKSAMRWDWITRERDGRRQGRLCEQGEAKARRARLRARVAPDNR